LIENVFIPHDDPISDSDRILLSFIILVQARILEEVNIWLCTAKAAIDTRNGFKIAKSCVVNYMCPSDGSIRNFLNLPNSYKARVCPT
jgi:hypothetical protein